MANENNETIESGQDPANVHITHHQQTADDDGEFAKAEAGFAAMEHRRAEQLRADGRWLEADYYDHDASERMHDAERVMDEATKEEYEAKQLVADKQRKLALELQRASNQTVASLRNAVGEVRTFVQNLTPNDELRVGLSAHLDLERIVELRETVVVTGFAIEQALARNGGLQEQNIQQVIFDLITFTAAVMTLADHLPALMEVVQRFGQLLLQFHF